MSKLNKSHTKECLSHKHMYLAPLALVNATAVEEVANEPGKKIVFVHLGKTAGSSIICMLHPSTYHSGTGDSNCNIATYRPSAIAAHVVSRVHLDTAPVDAYDDFLVTMRHPVDRIVSWFYYVHPAYPPKKYPQHRRGCEKFSLFRCWGTIQELSERGLAMEDDSNFNRGADNDSSCRALALDMVAGRRKCWHNYFNYNFTYGRLVDQLERQRDKGKGPSFGDNGDEKTKRIYAIRMEHLEEDWKTINTILGGSVSESLGAIMLHKNNWAPTTGNPLAGPNKTLSTAGRLNLCRVLCKEIQIYKKILHLAVNIDAGAEKESLEELVEVCPEETVERCLHK